MAPTGRTLTAALGQQTDPADDCGKTPYRNTGTSDFKRTRRKGQHYRIGRLVL